MSMKFISLFFLICCLFSNSFSNPFNLKIGMTEDEIGIFIERILQFCDDYDMNENDTLLNLNNLGWNPVFGARIIDYGLSNEMIDKFYTKEEDENV